MKIIIFLILSFSLFSREIFLKEDFNNLKNWEKLSFPKIKRHTEYKIIKGSINSVLKAETNNSASALIYKKKFNVYDFPYVQWKWKVENIYKKGNVKKKKGDDYPIRVYIFFEYNPEIQEKSMKFKDKLAKKMYGKYPPHSSLNYIWASKAEEGLIINSAYTKRSKMFVLRSSEFGKWKTEKINILKDYKKAFKKDPPKIASIAVMSDSDNTKEKAIAFIDYIKVLKK